MKILMTLLVNLGKKFSIINIINVESTINID